MEGSNPVKSFGPAKGLNASKFFDRIRFRDVAALVGAVAVLLLAMGISSVSYKLHKEGADALDNHARVEENSELTYYLTVNEDGVDSTGKQSSDTVTANISGGMTSVTDRLPDGLEFVGFVATEDGTIGAAARSDSSIACGGHVIDDTKEEKVDGGSWNADHTEYYYHGLHYDVATRTVSFRVENVQAGCGLTVGIVTKTPSLGTNKRLDFYNTANLKEGILNKNSNTMHVWMGRNGLTTYDVTYAYTGTVPENAPAAPETQSYVDGATVQVAGSPIVDGYQFSGWTTSDTEVTLGTFTMPTNTVAFIGSFAAKPAGTKYNVTYQIDGDIPEGYVAPKTKSYEAGSMVKLDSTQKGHLMDKYVFSGWSTEDVTLEETGFIMPAKNVVIHGSFEERKYTVSYEFEGEVMPPNAKALLPEAQEYLPGTKVTRAADPVANGYKFTGWYKNESFIMPEENVVIYGEWSVQNGVFSPEISKKVVGDKTKYMQGDTVVFETTVKNTANYPISDVQLLEELEGAVFVEGDGYTVKDEGYALVDTIPAGGVVTVRSEYYLAEDTEGSHTNTVRLVGATADGGYNLDTSKDYVATADFETKYYQEPLTPEEQEQKEKEAENAKTLDRIVSYVAVAISGIVGIIASIFMIRRTLKNDQLQTLAPKAKGSLQGLKNFLNPKTATKGRLLAMAVADVALVAVAAGLVVKLNLPQKIAERVDASTINLMSSSADYDSGEGGAWKITKSAKWTGDGKAQLTIDVGTVAKNANGRYTDVLFVVDVSGSMNGAKIDRVKQDMTELTDSLMSNGQNQVAMVSFESGAKKELDFTTDKTAAQTAIDNLGTSGCTNYYQAFKEAEGVLQNYQVQNNRDLFLLFLTDGYPNRDTPNERAEYTYLKGAYPTMVINAIQYEMATEILDPIKAISDNQYIANMDTLNNVLFEASRAPYPYDSFNIEDVIDTRYFEVESGTTVEALNPSLGTAELTEENGQQRIKWNMDGLLRSGSSAKLTVNLKLKDQYKRVAGEYPINSTISASSTISEGRAENKNSNETPILKNAYNVYYEANSPSDCTVANMPTSPEAHFVYETVEIGETIPTCAGYNFSGFVFTETGIQRLNEDYFRMPEKDVTLRATWTKADIRKSMDGTVQEETVATLDKGQTVNQKMKRLSGQSSATYDTVNTTITGIERAYELPANVSTTNSNNRISASSSQAPIYAWFNNGTIYYYAQADKIVMNANSSYMFYNMSSLLGIAGASDWGSAGTTDMSRMFSRTANLTDLAGASSWDTSGVKDMSYMFYNATGLTNIEDISNWNTDGVTNMDFMFSGATGLTNIDGAVNWDTSSVTKMYGMFYETDNLTNIDGAVNWNTTNVTNMSRMFYNAKALTNIDGASNWDTSSVSSMESMFAFTPKLANIDGASGWNTSEVKTMSNMFQGATGLTNINGLRSWNTSKVESMYYMFSAADNLTNIDGAASWDTSKVRDMGGMFWSTKISNIDALSNWDTSSVTSMWNMFSDASSLANINGASNWNTFSVTNMSRMFYNAKALTNIDGASNWDTSKVTSMGTMFYNAKALTNIDGASNWNTSSVTAMSGMFDNARGLTNIDGASNWNTSSVTNMGNMFYGASSLTDIDGASNWNTSSVTNMSNMFYGASSLTNIDGASSWNTSSVTNMQSMFQSTTNLANIDGASNWDTSSVTNMQSMFQAAFKITDLSPLNNWNTANVTNKANMFNGIPDAVARPTWY